MTEPRKINRKVGENQEVVTFRLPSDLLNDLDKTVAGEQSSRTAIIRRALALYHRMPEGVYVPTSQKTREKLRALFLQLDSKPAETLLEELLCKAVNQEYDAATQVIRVEGHFRMPFSTGQQKHRAVSAYPTVRS